jgi:hypothetical protein
MRILGEGVSRHAVTRAVVSIAVLPIFTNTVYRYSHALPSRS